jgi:hypothetical protein
MLPAMWPGDVVTVQRSSVDALFPGQIVLFHQQEKLTVHRLRRVVNGHFVARGDSLPCCDPPVGEDQLLGRVVRIERKGRVIGLEQTLAQRMIAQILRRSGNLRRLAMILGGDEPLVQLWDLGRAWRPWAS